MARWWNIIEPQDRWNCFRQVLGILAFEAIHYFHFLASGYLCIAVLELNENVTFACYSNETSYSITKQTSNHSSWDKERILQEDSASPQTESSTYSQCIHSANPTEEMSHPRNQDHIVEGLTWSTTEESSWRWSELEMLVVAWFLIELSP